MGEQVAVRRDVGSNVALGGSLNCFAFWISTTNIMKYVGLQFSSMFMFGAY